ncbi:uncharacterized protein PG998_001470 [Apiospora kogelbergensis]|uniref:Uncharacterized protein n=1 Tax=Apiospora kogelbergensis TaxID=1337665 RepID=A0AAW0QV42_9PEZI
MCYYKRATFSECNHSQWSPLPMRECQAQQDFRAGRNAEPCESARGHPLATLRVEGRCAACRGQADKMDERLRRVKDIISTSKQTLIGADERCRAILEDVGIDLPFSDDENEGAATPRSSPVSASATTVLSAETAASTAASTVGGESSQGGEENSLAKEFLRKRSEQKDSGLYMR